MTKQQARDLAYTHAPVFYQEVNPANTRGEFITKVNFTGNWDNIANNWENVNPSKGFKLEAHAYYSVVETHTHLYILYAFYHPQDWHDVRIDDLYSIVAAPWEEHEHDMEGCLALITKDEGFGSLDAIVTLAHWNFYSYIREGSRLRDGVGYAYGREVRREDIDGDILWDEKSGQRRFILFSEKEGHGIYGHKHWADERHGFPSGYGIIYWPSKEEAEEPQRPNDIGVKYKLIDIFDQADGLWPRRDNPNVFVVDASGFEVFNGNTKHTHKAKPPWSWNDRDDYVRPGAIAIDPAALAWRYFSGFREFSPYYLHNPYMGIFQPEWASA